MWKTEMRRNGLLPALCVQSVDAENRANDWPNPAQSSAILRTRNQKKFLDLERPKPIGVPADNRESKGEGNQNNGAECNGANLVENKVEALVTRKEENGAESWPGPAENRGIARTGQKSKPTPMESREDPAENRENEGEGNQERCADRNRENLVENRVEALGTGKEEDRAENWPDLAESRKTLRTPNQKKALDAIKPNLVEDPAKNRENKQKGWAGYGMENLDVREASETVEVEKNRVNPNRVHPGSEENREMSRIGDGWEPSPSRTGKEEVKQKRVPATPWMKALKMLSLDGGAQPLRSGPKGASGIQHKRAVFEEHKEQKRAKSEGSTEQERFEERGNGILRVKRTKDFECFETIKGTSVNVLKGLELHCGIFDEREQAKLVAMVMDFQEKGRKGQLMDRTYSEPKKWMRGKGRITLQFGCCYNYAVDKNGRPPGIAQDENVDPLPPLLISAIRRLVSWRVLPSSCIPDSCIVNIYDEGDCIPPHIDHHDFVRPFCTVSLLSECNIVFGSSLQVDAPGEFSGSFSLPLPVGSVLVINGNGADVAKHAIPAVPTKRMSITFRRMDPAKRPWSYKLPPQIQNLVSL